MSYHHRNEKDYGGVYGYNHGSSGYYSPYDRHLDHGDYRSGNQPSHGSNNPNRGDMGGMPPQQNHHGHHHPSSHYHHHTPPPNHVPYTATLNTKSQPQKKQRRSDNSDSHHAVRRCIQTRDRTYLIFILSSFNYKKG